MESEFFWNRVPFFRLLIPFLSGILFEIYLQTDIPFLAPLLLLLFGLLLTLTFIRKVALSYRFRSVFGVLLNVLLFLAGIYLVCLKTNSRDADHFSKVSEAKGFYYVSLDAPTLEKDRSLKVVMKVLAVNKNGKWIATSGKAMFYIQKDSLSENLRYGDRLLVNTSFTPVPPPSNPGEFNYKQFLYFHNIYSQAYVKAGEWKATGENNANVLLKWSYGLRDRLLGVLRESGLQGDEYAVAAALVLGYTDKLDADVISAYASTGALHVLSVSGLHVGIVYFVFNLFFSFLDKRKKGNIIKALLLLLIIWFYATLTGLSPSVLRSATMFSFIIFAKAFRYSTDIFNTLAVSCFVLLLYDPYLVMEVGFQLSFLAVFGIVFLQPRLYEVWQPKSKILDWIWTLTAVSLAAQLATFPLGLLYFHQFPNLFLFSNLVVIPVSTVVLYLGILLFFVSKITFLGWLVAKLLFWSVWALNASVMFMEKLPYSIIQGISISIFGTWLLYFMIASLTAFFFLKKRKYLEWTLGLIAFILVLQVVENVQQSYQKRIVVYGVPKTTAIDLVYGQQNVFISDEAFIQNKSRMLFHVKHNWWENGLDEPFLFSRDTNAKLKGKCMIVQRNFIQFCDKRILVLDTTVHLFKEPDQKIKLDYIIVSGDPKVRPEKVFSVFDAKKVIFDRSNSQWKIKKWKEVCEKNAIPTYDINGSGAYIEDL